MFRKGLLLFLLFIANLFANNCFAQDLYFEKITGQEIDPSTPIYGIAKDTNGYLWFGSWNGVYRYDGKSFDYYYHKINDKASLPNNRIRNIVFDKKSGLWFLTFDRKYAKYNYHLNSFSIVAAKIVPTTDIKVIKSNSAVLDVVDNNPAKNLELKAYPNPFSNSFKIEGLDETFQYRIYDVTGRLHLQGNATKDTVIGENLELGFYIIVIKTQSGTFLKKMIKNSF